MSILNTWFGDKHTNQTLFPKPTDDGEVSIQNKQLICTGVKGMHSCVVNLTELQYAYIKITPSKERYLFLFDHHQNNIPVTFKGFQGVYETLSSMFGFDDEVFLSHVNSEAPLIKQIWRRKHPKNYSVLDINHHDYHDGFEIQSQPKQFISWEITYRELENHQYIYFETSPYGQKLLKFKYPVRIGNVIFNDLQAYFDNKRTDVPVLYFYSDCYNDMGNDGSYYDLKHVLTCDLMGDEALNGYERDDQKNLIFDLKGIALSICYTYDSRYLFDAGNTAVTIQNHREYPELLTDKEYEARIDISEALPLQGDLEVSKDYMKNERITYRPRAVSERFMDQPVIWTDVKNDKIGFSAHGYAELFNLDEIESFSIQNMLPAKGSGGAYLEVLLINKTKHTVFSGRFKTFDTYKEDLERVTHKPVTFAKEYYDC
ncbi:hypothetical protein [Formosa sp. 4Alg 33]|uniref:hypothetical protein n=1 Tax=Formosa sp. 4Alg 33 TaxID=3382189 RepID=UPI003D9C346F